eukprot:381357_1
MSNKMLTILPFLMCLLVVISGNLVPGESSSVLVLRKEQQYDWIWDDAGTGSKLDGAFWKPKLNEGEAFVSFVGTTSRNQPPTNIISTIITSYPPNALADPIDYQLIWSDKKSGGKHSVWWYKPVAPIDYVCFGDFVSRSISIEDWDGYKCIHKDYVSSESEQDVKQKAGWNDNGSGASLNGQVFQVTVTGNPTQYYRMANHYGSSVDGPFYSFNTHLKNCDVISVDFSESNLLNQILHGTADTSKRITFENRGSEPSKTTGFEHNNCKTSSSSFTYSHGFSVGVQVTYGYAITGEIGSEIFGASTSVTQSFELQLKAEYHADWEETITTTEEICNTIKAQEITCPGRTLCKRDYVVFTAPDTEIPVSVTVQCNNNDPELVEGTFKATGAADIMVVDTYTPLDCLFYTDNYYDRDNGKLPNCWRCKNAFDCDVCGDDKVLIDIGCYDARVCQEECDGILEDTYCLNEDISLPSCQFALHPLICPFGSRQIGGSNADIIGCGLLKCDKRYNFPSIESCELACNLRPDCVSYSWASIGGDHTAPPGVSVCTLYNNGNWKGERLGPNQVLCEPVISAFRPCEIVTICDSVWNLRFQTIEKVEKKK